jgi:hypothetical protein
VPQLAHAFPILRVQVLFWTLFVIHTKSPDGM